MASIIKVDTIKDTGSNDIITSDGAGNVTLNASLSGFTSTGIDDNATSTAVTIDSSGNVGIGTSSPAEALEVQTSEATTGDLYSTAIRVTNSLDYGWGVGIDFAQPPTSGSSVAVTGAISSDFDSSNNYSTRFYTMGSGTLAERMRIDSSGNVGIGVNNPVYSLQVNGSIYIGSGTGGEINCFTTNSGSADDYKSSGFYRFSQSVTNNPSAHIYAVVVFGNSTNVVTQIATRFATNLTYVRSYDGSTWTSWARLDT